MAHAAGIAVSESPPQASQAINTSTGRNRFPPASKLYAIASRNRWGQSPLRCKARSNAASTRVRIALHDARRDSAESDIRRNLPRTLPRRAKQRAPTTATNDISQPPSREAASATVLKSAQNHQ